MPSLSTFYGIIIYMYKDDHYPPHIHARYRGIKIKRPVMSLMENL